MHSGRPPSIGFEVSNQIFEGDAWVDLFEPLGYTDWEAGEARLLDDGHVSIPVSFNTPEPETVYFVYIFEDGETTLIDEWFSEPPQSGLGEFAASRD